VNLLAQLALLIRLVPLPLLLRLDLLVRLLLLGPLVLLAPEVLAVLEVPECRFHLRSSRLQSHMKIVVTLYNIHGLRDRVPVGVGYVNFHHMHSHV
jgi:hypothetical protein